MPVAMARLSAGTSAFGSLADTAMAPTRWLVSVLMNGTWAGAEASDGPTCLNLPPSAAAAFLPPLAAVSKYGLLTAFGRKATLGGFLLALPDDELLLLLDEPLSPPHAATARASARMTPASSQI